MGSGSGRKCVNDQSIAAGYFDNGSSNGARHVCEFDSVWLQRPRDRAVLHDVSGNSLTRVGIPEQVTTFRHLRVCGRIVQEPARFGDDRVMLDSN